MKNSFDRWLRQEMARQNLNQTGLALKLGITQSAVSDWLRNVTQPRRENVHKLAQVLRVPIKDLYRALGRIPDDEEWSEDLRRIAGKLTALADQDRQIVETLVDNLVARQEDSPEQQ